MNVRLIAQFISTSSAFSDRTQAFFRNHGRHLIRLTVRHQITHLEICMFDQGVTKELWAEPHWWMDQSISPSSGISSASNLIVDSLFLRFQHVPVSRLNVFGFRVWDGHQDVTQAFSLSFYTTLKTKWAIIAYWCKVMAVSASVPRCITVSSLGQMKVGKSWLGLGLKKK